MLGCSTAEAQLAKYAMTYVFCFGAMPATLCSLKATLFAVQHSLNDLQQ